VSEQDTLLCQAAASLTLDRLCGKPAVWRYRALNGLPYLLCERCVLRFDTPWMQKRLTRLVATEGGSSEH
jgi:hypothetical protein